MKTLDQQLSELISQNIIQKQTTPTLAYYYKNEVIALQTSYYDISLTQEGKNLLPPNSFESFANLVDYIHYTTLPQPSEFFKSGIIKQGFLKEVILRLQSTYKNKYIVTKLKTDLITTNWQNLSPAIQKTLCEDYKLFNREGVCTNGWISVNIINQDGTINVIQVPNRDSIRQSIIVYRTTLYVYKNLPTTLSISWLSDLIHLTQGEEILWKLLKSMCTTCGTWENKQDLVFGLCDKCIGDSPKQLHGYSERATSFLDHRIGKSKYHPRVLGVELEYEYNTNTKELLYLLHRNLKNHAIFKRDGSLTNGVEICTRPASIDIHLDEFKKMFTDEECTKRLIVLPTCGMHVHIDRRNMSALSLGKLIQFMQASSNKSFLEFIAERSENRYSKLGTNLSVTSFHRGTAYSERYLGINTQNKHTAELRIFKTPTTFEAFLKNMEFVTALADFVQPANSSVQETTSTAFLTFVKKNQSTYKQLFSFCKGFI